MPLFIKRKNSTLQIRGRHSGQAPFSHRRESGARAGDGPDGGVEVGPIYTRQTIPDRQTELKNLSP